MKPTETYHCPHCDHKITLPEGTTDFLIDHENRRTYCASCDRLVRDDEWVKGSSQ